MALGIGDLIDLNEDNIIKLCSSHLEEEVRSILHCTYSNC